MAHPPLRPVEVGEVVAVGVEVVEAEVADDRDCRRKLNVPRVKVMKRVAPLRMGKTKRLKKKRRRRRKTKRQMLARLRARLSRQRRAPHEPKLLVPGETPPADEVVAEDSSRHYAGNDSRVKRDISSGAFDNLRWRCVYSLGIKCHRLTYDGMYSTLCNE